TTITPSVLGNMCLNINLSLDAPNVFEANTNSWPFNFKNSPLTTRLIPIQPVIAIANIIVHIDGSKINTNKITTINVGIDATISIIRCITLSSRPTKNPELAQYMTPMKISSTAATTPINNDTCATCQVRDHRSLPNWYVPN